MDISVQELTPVDKEIKINASREDLSQKFESAFKKYRAQMQMPGFRPGKVPLGIIKKRFGKEIELEEINSYVEEVYEKEIVPEHEPVGETQMVGFSWENDELEVTFKIGAKPEVELKELNEITVDKIVHDVSDEEVDEEIERTLERQGNWEESDGEITEESRVTVDAVSLDEEGNPIEGEKDEDQIIDLRQEAAKDFKEHLLGKKKGDIVKMELEEEDGTDRFEMHVKVIETMNKAELNDEFAKKNSNDQAKNVDEFKSYIKSTMQEYYDKSSDDVFKQDAIDVLTKAHDFDIPEVMIEQLLNSYVDFAKQESGGELPAGFDVDDYKNSMKEQAVREGKWAFISQKLQEKFDDIDITPEDIDDYIAEEAARYGMPPDQLKSFFAQNPSGLDNMRTSIRENKIFDKLSETVDVNELSKDEFNKKREEEKKAREEKEEQQKKKAQEEKEAVAEQETADEQENETSNE